MQWKSRSSLTLIKYIYTYVHFYLNIFLKFHDSKLSKIINVNKVVLRFGSLILIIFLYLFPRPMGVRSLSSILYLKAIISCKSVMSSNRIKWECSAFSSEVWRLALKPLFFSWTTTSCWKYKEGDKIITTAYSCSIDFVSIKVFAILQKVCIEILKIKTLKCFEESFRDKLLSPLKFKISTVIKKWLLKFNRNFNFSSTLKHNIYSHLLQCLLHKIVCFSEQCLRPLVLLVPQHGPNWQFFHMLCWLEIAVLSVAHARCEWHHRQCEIYPRPVH